MSGGDQQEKSEQATPFKLDEARKQGQVARSPELLSFTMLLSFLLILSASVRELCGVLAAHSHWWLGNAASLGTSWGNLTAQGSHSLRQLLDALMPLLGTLVLVAILTNLVFNGPVFSLAPIKPDFKRLHPIRGLKRVFSRRMLVELLKILAKGMLFTLVLYYLFRGLLPDLLDLATLAPLALPPAIHGLLLQVGFAVLIVMAAAMLFDIWYSRRDFARQMRMSRREVKDEHRRREGDPEVRSRRRQSQQELLQKAAALGKVKDADVIVVNPTQYAVALQYRPQSMRAPVIVAMGRGLLARRIRGLAREHHVPVLRRPALARNLHALARLDATIPEITQTEVAQIYRWIISLPGNKVMTP